MAEWVYGLDPLQAREGGAAAAGAGQRVSNSASATANQASDAFRVVSLASDAPNNSQFVWQTARDATDGVPIHTG